MPDQEMTLPIQEVLSGRAKRAYILAQGLLERSDAIGKHVVEKRAEFDRIRDSEYERIRKIPNADPELVEYVLLTVSHDFEDHLLRDERSAANIARSVLTKIVSSISRHFPEVSEEPVRRWTRDAMHRAQKDMLIMSTATSMVYASCSMDDDLKELLDLHGVLRNMASLVVDSSYEDQYLQCQMKLLDAQRRLMELQASLLEEQRRAGEVQTALSEQQTGLARDQQKIAEETAKQSTRMTIMTVVIMVATLITLAISIGGYATSRDDSIDEAIRLIENDVSSMQGSLEGIDKRLEGFETASGL